MSGFKRNREIVLRVVGVTTATPEGLLKPEESEVRVGSFKIIDRFGVATEIRGNIGNRYGRAFIQFVARLPNPEAMPTEMEWTPGRMALAEMVFAENWEDRHTAERGKGRPMLKALGYAVRIEEIEWKE